MSDRDLLASLASIAGAILAGATLPGTIELGMLTAAARAKRRPLPPRVRPIGRIAIVIPAHDEEAGIGACVASVLEAAGHDEASCVVVVADNCSDATSSLAREAGARVLERNDPGVRGKGHALAFAFERLLAEGFGALLVIDADTEIDPHAIEEVRRWLEAGADAVQLRYDVRDSRRSPLVRLRRLAFLGFNVLRPAGRDRLGLSAGILGNGFALTRETLLAVPFDAASIVEDLEYHLRLVAAERRVRFAPGASVRGEIPSAAAAGDAQSARWEGGRFGMLFGHGPPLLARALSGRPALLEPVADLALLPLGYHAMALGAAWLAGGTFVSALALVGIVVLAWHVVEAAFRFGDGFDDLASLAAAPGYLLRKLFRLPDVVAGAGRRARWMRAERPAAPLRMAGRRDGDPDVSLVVVSFNTRDSLRSCLERLSRTSGVVQEILVVDNASADGSADMVEREFPQVRLLRSPVNLGFAAANNLAFRSCRGRYVVLVNSDAFPDEGAIVAAVKRMEADPTVGLAGARLEGLDGSFQPSARSFPNPVYDFLVLTGLSARFPRSRWFGRPDRTFADPSREAFVDWVPGAFAVIRREALEEVAGFDERFFLYYEEVDLCRRLAASGWRIAYWPEVLVRHVGGASSRKVEKLTFSESGSQLTLWRMRSALLYYRKHHGGMVAWLAMAQECGWQRLRALRRGRAGDPESQARAADALGVVRTWQEAWRDTSGGRVSPPRPW